MIMPIQRRGGAADGTQDADVRLLVLYEDAPGLSCARRPMLLIAACRFFRREKQENLPALLYP
jgi:hypothetical protein